MREHGKHCACSGTARDTVASIRRRLVLERHLPSGVEPTPQNLLRYYGELPTALPGPHVTYHFKTPADIDASVARAQQRLESARAATFLSRL